MPKYQASVAACAASAGSSIENNPRRAPRPGAMALAVCIALGLSACGGGGGGGNVKSNPPPPTPPVDTSPMVVSTDLTVTSAQTITRPIVLASGADLGNQGAIGGTATKVAVEAQAPSIVTNRGGGTIRGSQTAIRMDHGGEIHNEAGATIEGAGTSGTDCGANVRCAIYAGPNDQAGAGQYDSWLTNAGTIIGNVRLDQTLGNGVELVAGGVIDGDLKMGFGDLALSGDAGTTQRLSHAVTGAIGFNGQLWKSGDGTWIVDKYLGQARGLTIQSGRLEIADGASVDPPPPPGDINYYELEIYMYAGELAFNRSDDVSLSQVAFFFGSSPYSFENSAIVQAGTGMLSLPEYMELPSTLKIERGTLRIGEDGAAAPVGGQTVIRSNVENAGSLILYSNHNFDWTGAISGTGLLIKNGNGSLLLSGANTYSGNTTINYGTLQASQVLPGHVFVNAPGALLPSAGVAGDLYDAGRVVVAGSDTSVGRDYQQTVDGTLAVSLGSKLAVTGLAWLDGKLEVTGANAGYVANTHTEVLTAGGGVNGTFAQLVKGAGVVFTSNTIHYDANSVWLDTTGLNITTAAMGDGIGYTPASMGSAVRVQGAFEQLNDRISTNTLAGVSDGFLQSAGLFQQAASIEAAQASLRSLSGELHAASAAMTFRAIDAGNQALSDHLGALRDGKTAFGLWTQQLGSGGGMARSGFDGLGFQLDGWLVGNDFRIGRSGVVGFAFGQGQGVQQLQAGADRDTSRRTEGMVYAGTASDRWYAQGRLGFGQFRQDVNRRLLLGDAAEGVWTRYGGRYQVAYAESGLRWNEGGVRIAPFVSMEYARSDRDAFAEEGAGGFGLRSDAQSTRRWQASAGLRAARQWSFGKGRSLNVGAHAQWFRTLGTTGEAMDASFVGLQQWSPLLGIGLPRHGSLAGVGLDARLSPKAMFKLSYDYEQGQYDNAHGMTAGLNVAF